MHFRLILLSLAISFSPVAPVAAEGKVGITEFKAYSFNSKTGTLSGNMLAKRARRHAGALVIPVSAGGISTSRQASRAARACLTGDTAAARVDRPALSL
jgi:hypothetical protein